MVMSLGKWPCFRVNFWASNYLSFEVKGENKLQWTSGLVPCPVEAVGWALWFPGSLVRLIRLLGLGTVFNQKMGP